MSESTAPVMIATVYAPTFLVWMFAIAAALIVPRYALRRRVPWPLLAVMILALMVAATAATWAVVKGGLGF